MKVMEKENIKNVVEQTNLCHLAIIMDGNRRWAKRHSLPSAMGHKKGVDALKETVRNCAIFGINYLTVYAFSTENWNRKPEEVEFLMDLLASTIKNELSELYAEGVVITFLGDISRFSDKLKKILDEAQEITKGNNGVRLQIALNYGARSEIVNAVKKIISKGISAEDITEDTISKELYTSGMPSPDLLIRTGGEMRISNYLLWQIAYSEFYVTDKFWPEFGEQALIDAILEFKSRQRRFGA